MAIGTSGNQFKNAGVVGRLMRELIEAQQATLMSSTCTQSPVLGWVLKTCRVVNIILILQTRPLHCAASLLFKHHRTIWGDMVVLSQIGSQSAATVSSGHRGWPRH